jgi:hypothetical protein
MTLGISPGHGIELLVRYQARCLFLLWRHPTDRDISDISDISYERPLAYELIDPPGDVSLRDYMQSPQSLRAAPFGRFTVCGDT